MSGKDGGRRMYKCAGNIEIREERDVKSSYEVKYREEGEDEKENINNVDLKTMF